MRALVAPAVMLTLLSGLPVGHAGHVPVSEFQKGCFFSESDWDDGVYDCGGGIPSIQRPTFDRDIDWLDDGDIVIGIESSEGGRAYPIRILDWHEIANDEVDGTPIVVSYCPLCGSSIVYVREVEDQVLAFHVSGFLFRSDLVMVDEQTHSLWPQIEGSAARGELHGTVLELYPSSTMAWGDWIETHPDTLVLTRPRCGDATTDSPRGCTGEFQRNYDRYPYGSYKTDESIGISGQRRGFVQELHAKAFVLGVEIGENGKAYPFEIIEALGPIHDEVDDTSVLVTWAEGDAHAFVRPEGSTFIRADDDPLVVVDDTGRAFSAVTGEGPDGVHLAELDALDLFWFAWLDHNPNTLLYTDNGTTVELDHEPPRESPGTGVLALLGLIAAVAVAVLVRRR